MVWYIMLQKTHVEMCLVTSTHLDQHESCAPQIAALVTGSSPGPACDSFETSFRASLARLSTFNPSINLRGSHDGRTNGVEEPSLHPFEAGDHMGWENYSETWSNMIQSLYENRHDTHLLVLMTPGWSSCGPGGHCSWNVVPTQALLMDWASCGIQMYQTSTIGSIWLHVVAHDHWSNYMML